MGGHKCGWNQFVYWPLDSLQLPFHRLHVWFVYQIVMLIQMFLDVQHGVFLLFDIGVFLLGIFIDVFYFFLQSILFFSFIIVLNKPVRFVMGFFTHSTPIHRTKLYFCINFKKSSFFLFLQTSFSTNAPNITSQMLQTSFQKTWTKLQEFKKSKSCYKVVLRF